MNVHISYFIPILTVISYEFVKIKLIITKMLQYIVLILALANPNYVTMELHSALRPTHAPTPADPDLFIPDV